MCCSLYSSCISVPPGLSLINSPRLFQEHCHLEGILSAASVFQNVVQQASGFAVLMRLTRFIRTLLRSSFLIKVYDDVALAVLSMEILIRKDYCYLHQAKC